MIACAYQLCLMSSVPSGFSATCIRLNFFLPFLGCFFLPYIFHIFASKNNLSDVQMNEELKELRKAKEKFDTLMHLPLMDVSDEDLVWAYHQDIFNSYMSKSVWKTEMDRRGISG